MNQQTEAGMHPREKESVAEIIFTSAERRPQKPPEETASPRTGTNPAGQPGRAACSGGLAGRRERESGGGAGQRRRFLEAGSTQQVEGKRATGTACQPACPPASLFNRTAQNKADPAWNGTTR